MGEVRVARARGTSIDRLWRQCSRGRTGCWGGWGSTTRTQKCGAGAQRRHAYDERERGQQATAHIRSRSMLLDLACVRHHLHCACLEGRGQGKLGWGGGWRRKEHDTGWGHGGCDGEGMGQDPMPSTHSGWLVGWLVGSEQERKEPCTGDRPKVTMVQPKQSKKSARWKNITEK